jgi:hypothetical protein
LWFAYFFYNLKRRPLLPIYDPMTKPMLEAATAHD